MVRIKSPCYGCQNRTVTCHSDCEKYLEYRNECDRIRLEKMKRYDFKDYICRKVEQNSKK